ncbi:MAG TPA: pantoate--beta-alanine ligase [Actinomycetota bacterium]|nr:pantoate--beta-alanine ligase [Actinomycetota bacterium]
MEVISSAERFRQACVEARSRGESVGFVPTMGALHQGHARLLKRARDETAFVALSIFVNPLQFGSGEDLAAYPRTLDRDRAVAESLRTNVLFCPDEEEMYRAGPPLVTVDPGPLGDRLEGASRPGHFRGVLTVVAKLFNMVGPSRSYFGEKDAQQLALVRRMVSDLDVPVEVIGCPTVREIDGVALSSRNSYLSPEDRRAAPVLFDALSIAASLVRTGERRAGVLKAEMARRIGAETRARIDYVAIVDDSTWEDVETVSGPARALVAARIGPARLIDNLLLPWEPGWNGQNTEQPEQEGR